MGILFTAFIPGRPYVKKNQAKVFGRRMVYTPEFRAWEQTALLYIKQALTLRDPIFPLEAPVILEAEFRFANRSGEPDLSALYEGIQDVLQKAGVIRNDKQIQGHDGSRKVFGGEPGISLRLLEFNG